MTGSLADVHRIDNDLWAIDEIGKDIMYLIDGGRRALLIDTGFGMLDLKAIAVSIAKASLNCSQDGSLPRAIFC